MAGGHGHDHHDHDEVAEVAHEDQRVLEREQALGGASPRVKVLALAAALLANMLAPSAMTPLVIFAASVVLLLRAGVPRGTLLKRLMVPWYFAAVVLLTQVFFLGQTELFRLGPAVARLEGLWRGIEIASKVIGGTAAVLVLSMTTPMTGLLATAAWLRVPPLVVEIAALTYRYLFLLAEEAERIREAQKTRLGHSSWWKSMRSYSTLGGMVMVNSYDRAERVYQSMVMRGYSGSIPVESGGRGLNRDDLRVLALTVIGLVSLLAVDWIV